MELNNLLSNVVIKKTAFDGNTEQPIESDITLPEYFPDIVRVLRCTLTPNVSSVNSMGDRITAEGNAVLAILYISDDGRMHCFEQRIPYSKFVESKAVEGCQTCANAKTEYINCRVVSQRRLDIHGSITINFKAYSKCPQTVVRSCENKTVQMRKQQMAVSNMRDCCIKSFNISETLEIGSSQASIGQIVRSDAVALLEDTKIVAGKILVKGELRVHTVYLSETDFTLQKIEHSMPISQIIEVDTAEDSTDITNLSVSSLEVFAKTDSSGALRLIDMTAVVRADIDVYDNDEINCAVDSYSTEYELEQKKANIELQTIAEKFYDTYLCRGTVDLTGINISSLIDLNCTGITAVTEVADGELKISGTVTVCMLIANTESEIYAYDRQFDYEYKRTVATCCESKKCQQNVTVTGLTYLLTSENKVDIRVEVDINASVFGIDNKLLICDLSSDESRPKTRTSASLTIYFAEEGENVWEIARRYNTTVEAIKCENKLTQETINERCKLLIPSA